VRPGQSPSSRELQPPGPDVWHAARGVKIESDDGQTFESDDGQTCRYGANELKVPPESTAFLFLLCGTETFVVPVQLSVPSESS
jgi:hypothetical protein